MTKKAFSKTALPKRKIVIALDGPAASGKSTLAKKAAAALDFAYLDTGSIFRTIALETLKRGGDPSRIEDIRPCLDVVRSFTPEMMANPDIRSDAVSEAAPKVAALLEVREAVVAYQHAFARRPPHGKKGIVMDGRDVGTVVFPDAEVKIYVTATPEERARRRFKDMQKTDPGITFEEVLADINERDRRDTTRHFSPLHAAPDSIVIDTTTYTLAESETRVIETIREKLKGQKRAKMLSPAPQK